MELALKHATAEKKLEKEAFLRAQKESERESRNVKKVELQLRACEDSLTNAKLAHEKILEQVDWGFYWGKEFSVLRFFPCLEKNPASFGRG